VARDRLSYETSGGGVTFSGGDPLFQPEFLLALLEACRRAELRTAVDTCGFARRSVVLAVAARTDLLLWDLKHADPARHRALTGAPLRPILDNLAAAAATGVPIWLRIPVIAGLNDDAETMAGLARVAAKTPCVRRISLLPYHRMGTGKLARLGRRDALAATRAPSSERMHALSRLFEPSGVETRIGG
jgi:pyruvate formate lyase activating enzyme